MIGGEEGKSFLGSTFFGKNIKCQGVDNGLGDVWERLMNSVENCFQVLRKLSMAVEDKGGFNNTALIIGQYHISIHTYLKCR